MGLVGPIWKNRVPSIEAILESQNVETGIENCRSGSGNSDPSLVAKRLLEMAANLHL